MKSTVEYIKEAKDKLGISSDYALSKELGLTKQAISKYQTGERVMDDYTAAKIANVLEINPLEPIAAANAEREKDAAKVDFWRRLGSSSKAASLGGVLILGAFLIEGGALDFYDLYIMRSGFQYVILAVLGIGLTYKIWESHHAKKGPF